MGEGHTGHGYQAEGMIEGGLPYLATCLYPLSNEPLEGKSWVLSTIVSPAPDTQSYPLGQQIPIYKGR